MFGSVRIVTSLLENGARRKATCHQDWTALYYASNFGQLNVICRLVEDHRVPMRQSDEDDDRNTPLDAAIKSGRADVIKYFIFDPHPAGDDVVVVATTGRIRALKMLGALYGSDETVYKPTKCFRYLRLAMLQLYADLDSVIEKDVLPPVDELTRWRTTTTTSCA